MPTKANIDVDVANLSTSDQQETFDALYATGNVTLPPGTGPTDPASMTDAELAAAVGVLLDEIAIRPSTTHTPSDTMEFEGSTIVREVTP